jgi:hypothetical protein
MGFNDFVRQLTGVPLVKNGDKTYDPVQHFENHPIDDTGKGLKSGGEYVWDKSGANDLAELLKEIPLLILVGGGLFIVNEVLSIL